MSKFGNIINSGLSNIYAVGIKIGDTVFRGSTLTLRDPWHIDARIPSSQILIKGSFKSDQWIVVEQERSVGTFAAEWHSVGPLSTFYGKRYSTADIKEFVKSKNPKAYATFEKRRAAYERPLAFFRYGKASSVNPA